MELSDFPFHHPSLSVGFGDDQNSDKWEAVRDDSQQSLDKDYFLLFGTAIEPALGLARLQQTARELMFRAMA